MRRLDPVGSDHSAPVIDFFQPAKPAVGMVHDQEFARLFDPAIGYEAIAAMKRAIDRAHFGLGIACRPAAARQQHQNAKGGPADQGSRRDRSRTAPRAALVVIRA